MSPSILKDAGHPARRTQTALGLEPPPALSSSRLESSNNVACLGSCALVGNAAGGLWVCNGELGLGLEGCALDSLEGCCVRGADGKLVPWLLTVTGAQAPKLLGPLLLKRLPPAAAQAAEQAIREHTGRLGARQSRAEVEKAGGEHAGELAKAGTAVHLDLPQCRLSVDVLGLQLLDKGVAE